MPPSGAPPGSLPGRRGVSGGLPRRTVRSPPPARRPLPPPPRVGGLRRRSGGGRRRSRRRASAAEAEAARLLGPQAARPSPDALPLNRGAAAVTGVAWGGGGSSGRSVPTARAGRAGPRSGRPPPPRPVHLRRPSTAGARARRRGPPPRPPTT